MATATQIKIIHSLKGRLGLTDEEYRGMVFEAGTGYPVSSKELTEKEAAGLIRTLEAMAVKQGVWTQRAGKGWGRRRFEELGGRENIMATPRQLRMIEAMWRDVSRARTDDERRKTLRSFLKRLVRVETLEFLEKKHVQVIITALEAMKEARV